MKRLIGAGLVLLAALGVGIGLHVTQAPTPKATVHAPAHIGVNLGCGSDITSLIQGYLNGIPNNTTVTWPYHGCWTINGTLWLHGKTGITINGNGLTLNQTVAATTNAVRPVLMLSEDTNVKVSNLTINGAFDGTNGGAGREGQYGWLLEADTNIMLTHDTILNVQGDFFNLQAPFCCTYVSDGNQALNKNITITYDHFENAGYHGVVAESVNGAQIAHDTFLNDVSMPPMIDAIDFEYDIYSSGPVDANGIATYAAEDNVTFNSDTWTNFNSDWFASIQPAECGVPLGVQEDNIKLINNTINPTGAYAVAEIEGTQIVPPVTAQSGPCVGSGPTYTNADYIFNGFTLANNKALGPAQPIRGSGGGPPPGTGTIDLDGVANVHISGNTLPIHTNPGAGGTQVPFIAVVRLYDVHGIAVTHNGFSGGLEIMHPDNANSTSVSECGNLYGNPPGTLDSTC